MKKNKTVRFILPLIISSTLLLTLLFYLKPDLDFFVPAIKGEKDSLVSQYLADAELFKSEQRNRQALQQYMLVLEIEPHIEAYKNLGMFYLTSSQTASRKQDYKTAEEMFDSSKYYLSEGLNYWPEDTDLNYNLGLLYLLRNDQYKASEEMFFKVLQTDPGHKKAYKKLAELYMRQKRFDKAKEILLKAIEFHPLYSSYYTELGIIYAQQGLWNKSQEYLEKAIELKASDLKAKYYLQSVKGKLRN